MSEVEWQTGIPSGNHLATYRGIRIVIGCDETGKPLEITWLIGGQVQERIFADSDLETAEKNGIMVVDQRMLTDQVWQRAEKDDRESSIWNTPSGSRQLPECL
jgi:hypothetical protein